MNDSYYAEYEDDDRDGSKIVISHDDQGDWYISICPVSHKVGLESIRLCASGGASYRNPKLRTAIIDAFEAITGRRW